MDRQNEAQNIKMLLPLVYILPTFILYFIIIYFIFISKLKKNFSGPFYKLFGISATVYPVCSTIYYFSIRMPNTPFLIPFVKQWGQRSFFITFLQTSLWYVTNVAPLFHLAISFNRFSAFILKVKYEKFWNNWLYFIVGFCLIFPLFLIWHIPFSDIYMELDNESDVNSLRYLAAGNRKAIPWMNNPRNAAILLTLCSLLSLIFNVYCIIKLLIEKFLWKNPNRKKTSKSDILLTVYTMLIFACDALHCFHQYSILAITDYETINLMFEIQNFLFDISDLAPAWFIIITNKNLRNQILDFVFKRKSKVVLIMPSMKQSAVGSVTHK